MDYAKVTKTLARNLIMRSILWNRFEFTRCLVPDFDGVIYSKAWRDALWDKFYTAALQRQRQCVEPSRIKNRRVMPKSC